MEEEKRNKLQKALKQQLWISVGNTVGEGKLASTPAQRRSLRLLRRANHVQSRNLPQRGVSSGISSQSNKENTGDSSQVLSLAT